MPRWFKALVFVSGLVASVGHAADVSVPLGRLLLVFNVIAGTGHLAIKLVQRQESGMDEAIKLDLHR